MAGARTSTPCPTPPGINDNGSGSAALLEIAWQMRKVKPTNKVRFAWWGAEEGGLLGSTHYVTEPAPRTQAAQIKLYLNFDMIASANYTLGVYDGDDSAAAGFGPRPGRLGRDRGAFQASSRHAACPPRQPTSPDAPTTVRSSRSASRPVACSPAPRFRRPPTTSPSGAAWPTSRRTRATTTRATASRRSRDGADPELYRQLDRQYPLIGNINLRALDVNADAIATAVITYAFDTSSMPPRPAAATAAGSAARTAAAVPATNVKGRYNL